jgi:hypothetical protein
MKRQYRIASIVSTILMMFWFASEPLLAQQSNNQPPAQQQPSQTAPTANTAAPVNAQSQSQVQPAPQQQPGTSGTTVNPSQGPLQPVTTYPNANDTQQQQQPDQPLVSAPAQATTAPEAPQPKKPAEPVGAAAAESVPTAGGAAAKPAGVAIAPAKQHQTRSLLIKVGAALAAGAAIGTVFALSHSTPSTPPGTTAPGVVQK